MILRGNFHVHVHVRENENGCVPCACLNFGCFYSWDPDFDADLDALVVLMLARLLLRLIFDCSREIEMQRQCLKYNVTRKPNQPAGMMQIGPYISS